MAGTRLVVHSIFVIELIILVGISFFYASNCRHDPSASAEPFLPDQSGWRIVVEDVSPSHEVAGADGILGIIAYAGECASMVLSQIQSLIGSSSSIDTAMQHDRTRRRSSAFVQEMRRLVAGIHGADGITAPTQNRISHPLKVILRIPQTILSHEVTNIGEALEKGLRRGPDSDLPRVVLETSSRSNNVDVDVCDDFHLPTIQSRQWSNHREVKYPEIFILIGCTTASIPTQQMSSVEVIGNSDILIVRSKRTLDQINEFLSDLENEISTQILSRMFGSSTSEEYRLGKVFVNLIDENPASHVAGQSSIETKDRFNIIGNALSSSVQSVIGHFLEDLSFIYGGEMEQIDGERVIHGMSKIGLEVHSSAYLPVPDDIIVKSVDEGDGHESNATIKYYVSSENLASWMHTHSRKAVRNANCLTCRSVVEWTLIVPSKEHFPLMVRDDDSGEVGESIILSQHPGQLTTNGYPTGTGMSIVNIRSVGELFDSDSTGDVDFNRQLYQLYQDRISKSLVHLVGFLRASYGLPVFTTLNDADGDGDGVGVQTLSFWELESIARSHYTFSLENALQQTDALFAVLHRHGRTIALPMDVAHKLNNATNLLRQSIALVEKGYPTIYATSLIHGALQRLESVQSDHRVYELPYFALDHYLAVFSPLVLPLLLPMLAGFIREVKRYRELRKKKIEIL